LVGSQASFDRILRDVVTQAPKLAFVPHKVIESILLPKPALSAETTINLPSSEVLPRIALFDHRCLIGERGEQMDVIRHDDEVEHLVTITIEVQQAFGDNVCDPALRENTRAMPRIQRLMPSRGEAVVVFDHRIGRQLLHSHLPAFLHGIDALGVELTIAIRSPAIQNIFRHRVRCSPGDEDHAAILRPVRQSPLGDEQIVVRIEETHIEMLWHSRIGASKVAILLRKMSGRLAQHRKTFEV
jgi:hypothetical protein